MYYRFELLGVSAWNNNDYTAIFPEIKFPAQIL